MKDGHLKVAWGIPGGPGEGQGRAGRPAGLKRARGIPLAILGSLGVLALPQWPPPSEMPQTTLRDLKMTSVIRIIGNFQQYHRSL